METEAVKVIFRTWRGTKDVIAFFPEIPADVNSWYNCLSYERLGQHGGADYLACVSETSPATSVEYRAIAAELRRIGYRLELYRRETSSMRDARKAEWERTRDLPTSKEGEIYV